jgi:hypothetical protein
VPVSRPRDLATLTAPAFMDVKRRILGLLYGEDAA